MDNGTIGVGIIGTGRISDLHVVEYLDNPATRIVALCDANVERARRKAEEWGVKDARVTDDHAQLLGDPAVDLVDILVPHDLHLPIALEAIKAEKAVSLQKPMCVSLEEADRLVEAANAALRPFRVFENFIFFPPVAKAAQLVREGAIGEPLSIRLKSNPGTSRTAWEVPRDAEAWRYRLTGKGPGGGPLVFDDGHHKFALAWLFMGDPEEVHAFIGRADRGNGSFFDAQSQISFRFPGNRIGNLEVVYSPELEIATRHYAQDDRVEITGSKGVIWINCGHGRLPGSPPLAVFRDGRMRRYSKIETAWNESFVLSTRHFINVVRNGGRPVLTADEARRILQFAIAAETSAAEGRTVSLSSGAG